MEKLYITLVLHKIQTNGKISRLLKEGMTFKEIADYTEEAINLKYIEFDQGRIAITESGAIYYNENISLIKNSDKESWIDLDKKNKISAEELNFVYLPDKNSLNF